MFIQLKHKSLDVYLAVRELTLEVYKTSMLLPAEANQEGCSIC
jgi:hypothetical protein